MAKRPFSWETRQIVLTAISLSATEKKGSNDTHQKQPYGHGDHQFNQTQAELRLA